MAFEDLEIIILPQKTSDDLRGAPRMIASDIAWDVDTNDVFDFLSAKPDKEAAAILGIPKSTYAAMNNNRQYEYIHELIQKDESLSVKILGLPDEVEIPVNIVQKAESLNEIGSYLCDTFGYHHGGFDVCFDRPLAEMENMEVPESQQEYFHKLIEFGREEDSLYNEYLNDRNNELELD